ncbi:Alpha-mannosidase 2C1 [Lamellibrachia satsuma]|nr:Alpha-mannosidase 2C1 [Lamellibrachia satsuma]
MAVPGYVLKNRRTTFERAQKFISSTTFTDVNLYGKLYPLKADITRIQHCAVPGLITSDKAITFEKAINGTYEDTHVGASFGPTWTTHWFRLDIQIPSHWAMGKQVMLVWDSGSEAMIWKDGKPLQGLSPGNKRTEFVLTKSLDESNCRHTLYVEMECSDLFGAGKDGIINPPDPNKYYTLRRADIVVKDPEIYQLLVDFEVLVDLIEHLPEESNRSYQLLYGVNDMMNACQCQSSYNRAREIAQKLLSERNSEMQHTLCAIGHCHIDTAWLWPYEETKRKCARSWSSTIRLMQDYPEFIFVCSQAQQFDWVKKNYPSLYADIKDYVDQERFIPVGGTWVEMDGNIPSGEAFVRQFLYGQRFFEQEFGKRCTEFWLPDTFGYSAQLPQIMRHAGITRFVTQKLSWSLVNKFPHNTFWWRGLDGSKVLSHFPPGDSYLMECKAEEPVARDLKFFLNVFRVEADTTSSSLFQ